MKSYGSQIKLIDLWKIIFLFQWEAKIHLFDRKMFSNNSDSFRPRFGFETIIQRSNVASSFFADSTVLNLRFKHWWTKDYIEGWKWVKMGQKWPILNGANLTQCRITLTLTQWITYDLLTCYFRRKLINEMTIVQGQSKDHQRLVL